MPASSSQLPPPEHARGTALPGQTGDVSSQLPPPLVGARLRRIVIDDSDDDGDLPPALQQLPPKAAPKATVPLQLPPQQLPPKAMPKATVPQQLPLQQLPPKAAPKATVPQQLPPQQLPPKARPKDTVPQQLPLQQLPPKAAPKVTAPPGQTGDVMEDLLKSLRSVAPLQGRTVRLYTAGFKNFGASAVGSASEGARLLTADDSRPPTDDGMKEVCARSCVRGHVGPPTHMCAYLSTYV